MAAIEGRVLTPEGFRPGRVIVENGRIRTVEEALGVNNRVILPGFIDLHCHGGGGADVMDVGDAATRVAEMACARRNDGVAGDYDDFSGRRN